MPSETLIRLRRWFWRAPRPHGETNPEREVSTLELLYDLAYVAVISQAAHHLAESVSARSMIEFAVVFVLIWVAWMNGSLYLELHGREDGPTRAIVFVQMGILALLAVFTATAGESTGRAFALVYATLLVVMTWLWYVVRKQDVQLRPEFLPEIGRYVLGMSAGVVAILVSAYLPAEARLAVWAAFGVAWMVGIVLFGRTGPGLDLSLIPSDSLVERFGLFTIIVLGEVVFGVVDGLSSAARDPLTITTGLIALWLGFGFWWIYFDLVGRRLPRREGPAVANWILGHFPITLSIAAAGAGMVSLIGHAHDASTPASTAWLLAGAVALGLLALIPTERALVDAERLGSVYRPLSLALAAGAVAAGIVGWARPTPWLLALLLVAILVVLWLFAITRFLGADAWGDPEPGGAEPEATPHSLPSSGANELLASVDVVRGAGEGTIAHQVDGEGRHVGGAHNATDG